MAILIHEENLEDSDRMVGPQFEQPVSENGETEDQEK